MFNIILVVFIGLVHFTLHASQKSLTPTEAALWELEQKWTDQNNKNFKLAEFKGRTTIATMTFINCPGACALMISDMKEIDKRLTATEQRQIRFKTFSFDPNRDTPNALKVFYEKMHLDKRWNLYTSDEDQARKLSEVLKFNYNDLGDGDYSHSTSIYLISKKGHILFRKDNSSQLDELIQKLKYDLNSK